MVYYRKYRPQKISELDLDSVRKKLAAILLSKDLPHAFLFTGPKGLGKTSSARILAKAINCENSSKLKSQNAKLQGKSEKLGDQEVFVNESIEPCNECQACVSITNGSNVDVLEIDAASNGGVEEIRALRERVKFAPSSLRKKVYIIDEVHMLSIGAFNALLKTLEEPPSHVVFILATTELWKLPETVVSRTFQVQFEKPTANQMARSLARIVEGEQLKIDDTVLLKVAEISGGAFRDAAKNLEELVLAAGGLQVTLDLFDKTFKTQGIESDTHLLLVSYEARDAKKALLIIEQLAEKGADFKIVFEKLVDHLRGLLMKRNNIETEVKDVPGLTVMDIRKLLELSNEAYGELRASIIPQLPLELMTVKFCILDEEEVSGRSKHEESNEKKAVEKEAVTVIKVKSKELVEQDSVSNESKSMKLRVDVVEEDILQKLRIEVDKINKPAGALLRSCKSVSVESSVLTIVTPFPMHEKIMKSDRVLPDLEKAASSIVGEKVSIRIIVG